MGSLEDEYLVTKTTTYLERLNDTRQEDTVVFGNQKGGCDQGMRANEWINR